MQLFLSYFYELPQSNEDPDIESQLIQLLQTEKVQEDMGLVISGNALEEAIKVEGFYALLESSSACGLHQG